MFNFKNKRTMRYMDLATIKSDIAEFLEEKFHPELDIQVLVGETQPIKPGVNCGKRTQHQMAAYDKDLKRIPQSNWEWIGVPEVVIAIQTMGAFETIYLWINGVSNV